MIVIKTTNGDHFINEKSVIEVQHDREKAVVNCYGANGYFSHHEDVEGVIYTNDAQPTSWKDEGSEIQRLKKELDEQREWADKMRYEHLQMMQERDELKERLAQLEPKASPDSWWPDNVDSAPVDLILFHIGSKGYDPGYQVRLGKIFEMNNIKALLPHMVYYCAHSLHLGQDRSLTCSRQAVGLILTKIVGGRPVTNITFTCKRMLRTYKNRGDFWYYEKAPEAVKLMVNRIDMSALADLYKVTKDRRI